MASLILGAGFLVHGKIQQSKNKKKEKKRKSYEARYSELEKEHKLQGSTYVERKDTGGSSAAGDTARSVEGESAPRRPSTESQRSKRSDREPDDDNPARWVEEAHQERLKQR